MTLAQVLPKRMTAGDVRSCMLKHFGAGGKYAVQFEVRNAAGFNANRSIDAVVMSLWPSLGLELWGMEIKVDRGDWLREAKHPAKASDVWHHFDRWFLVAPDDVAKPGELPEPWGWYVPIKGGLRRQRDAGLNKDVKPISRGMLAMLMRQTARKDAAPIEQAVADALEEVNRDVEGKIERRVLERLGPARQELEQWLKIKELLKEKPEDWISQSDVIDALRILLKCGVARSYGGLQSLIAEADRIQTNLNKIALDLGIEPIAERKRK